MNIRSNLIANFCGSIWSALMSLLFVPFYIKMLGAESFGLVGVFTAINGMLSILDLGLSQAMNREMARLSAFKERESETKDLAKTLEIIYWIMAVFVFLVIIMSSRYIAFTWLQTGKLTKEVVLKAIWIMALVVGLRWPSAIYIGGLNGLQRQVEINVTNATFSTFQGIGSLLVLIYISSTVEVFFLWQAVLAVFQVAIFRRLFWRRMPQRNQAKVRFVLFKNIWRFVLGMTGVSLVATILTQMDKIVLSRILSLEAFGYYTFASTIAAGVFRLISPVFTAFYPKLTGLVAEKDDQVLVKMFHAGCQVMALVVLPTSFVLAIFAPEILDIWTHNHDLIKNTSLVIELLVVGNVLNALVNIPYGLQLAFGWTKLSFYQNLFAVAFLLPALYFFSLKWGALGAALVWLILNLSYVIISMQIMFNKFLRSEKTSWYLHDVILPAVAALIPICTLRALLQPQASASIVISALMLGFLLSSVAIILSSQTLRNELLIKYNALRAKP